MKRKIISVLLLTSLFILYVSGYSLLAVPQEEPVDQEELEEKLEEENENKLSQAIDEPLDCTICKLILDIHPPRGPFSEELERQLTFFKKIAAIVNAKNRKSLMQPYTSAEKHKIAGWLTKAAQLESQECAKKYWLELASNIREFNTFGTLQPHWNSLEGNRGELIFSQSNGYLTNLMAFNTFLPVLPAGFNWEFNTVFDTLIYINKVDDTRFFEEYSDIFPKLQDHLPFQQKIAAAYSPVIPRVKLSELVYTSAEPVFSMAYPNFRSKGIAKYTRARDFELILFNNVIEPYYSGVIEPIARQIYAGERLWNLEYDIYLSHLIMRRFSHHLGPVFSVIDLRSEEYKKETKKEKLYKRKPKKKKSKKKELVLKNVHEVLEELFPVIESIKSHVVAVHNTTVLIETGLLAEDKDIVVYATYLATLVDRLRNRPSKVGARKFAKVSVPLMLKSAGGPEYLAALVQFNYFFLAEAINFNINSGKLEIDRLKFQKTVALLAVSVLKIMDKGTYSSAMRILNKYRKLPPQLMKIVKLLEDIPIRVEYRTNFAGGM
ncbi:MAG: hypothetical protein GY757_11050 [bacterium]|nr:hypothetical protein [bacterium]